MPGDAEQEREDRHPDQRQQGADSRERCSGSSVGTSRKGPGRNVRPGPWRVCRWEEICRRYDARGGPAHGRRVDGGDLRRLDRGLPAPARLVLRRARAFERVLDRLSTSGRSSCVTSEISEMTRNLARSSMRFSRNERFFERARYVRLFSTSTTSKIEPVRIRSELSLKRPFQFWWVSILPSLEQAEEPLDFLVTHGLAQPDVVGVLDGHEHRRVVRHHAELIEPARRFPGSSGSRSAEPHRAHDSGR